MKGGDIADVQLILKSINFLSFPSKNPIPKIWYLFAMLEKREEYMYLSCDIFDLNKKNIKTITLILKKLIVI